MKRWLFLSVMLGAMPLMLMAQDDDDVYFVPTKANVEKSISVFTESRPTSFAGSNRDVDEYNRRYLRSHYEPVGGSGVPADSTASDIIEFSAVEGVYPDSLSSGEDFELTRQLSRWDGYTPSEAYDAGYTAGANDVRDALRNSWHSPWFYSGPYSRWYDWYYGWGPWYAGYYDWYYDPWYWNTMYGGYYDPWFYASWRRFGWDGPYYYGGWNHYGWYGGTGGSGRYGRNSYVGTIDRGGSSRGRFTGYRGGDNRTTAGSGTSSSRYNSARNRTVGNHSNYSGGGVYTNNGGNFSGTRSTSSSIGASSNNTSFGSVSGGGGGARGGSRGGSISRGGRR